MNTELYITLKIKAKTAAEFRKYCRHLGKQQTEGLQLMLDFFKSNGLSPLDELGPNFITLEKRIKVRINAVVAILKDIEKTQTKPTHAMLQLLFSENPVNKKELLKEKSQPEISENEDLQREMMAYKSAESELRKKLSERTEDFKIVLENVAIVRNNFGRVHLRLTCPGRNSKISNRDFKYKRYVPHDHSSKDVTEFLSKRGRFCLLS